MKLGPHWLREHRFWRRPVARDVDDELAFHLAMRAELLEDAGLDPRTARDTALQRFGDLTEVREQCITLSHERERLTGRGEDIRTHPARFSSPAHCCASRIVAWRACQAV